MISREGVVMHDVDTETYQSDLSMENLDDLFSVLRTYENPEGGRDHYFSSYVRIFRSNNDIKVLKTDFITHDMSIALDYLHALILKSVKKSSKRSKNYNIKWTFRRSIHRIFDKTLDDIFLSFLRWSAVPIADRNFPFLLNVHRAFRRLEKYADWLEKYGEDLTDTTVDVDQVKGMLEGKVYRHNLDEHGKFLVWIDMSHAISEFHGMSKNDCFRFFAWMAHQAMFAENAQQSSLIQYCAGQITFAEYNSIMDYKKWFGICKLGLSTSSLNIDHIYIIDAPGWMRSQYSLISRLLNKSTRSRFTIRKRKSLDVFEKLGILNSVPEGFGQGQTGTSR